MKRINNDKDKNIFQVELINNLSSQISNIKRSNNSFSKDDNNEDKLGVSALGFTIIITKASDIFFGIKNIRVFVDSPH